MPTINIEKSPPGHEVYVWADYIELLCLFNIDQEISRADVVDRVRKRRDDLGEGFEDFTNRETPPPERTDEWNRRMDDYFRHLEYREGAFREFYPFVLEERRSVLRMKRRKMLKHKLYVFLLLASNLNRALSLTSVLTRSFEALSRSALASMMPHGAQVHQFGSNTGRYKGSLWGKMKKLADDLKDTLIAKQEDFPPENVGDGGLDIVAWIHLGDEEPSLPLFFGQCTCSGTSWVDKQHSSGPETWRGKIAFTAPPSNMIFVPLCFRDSNGSWHRHDSIHQSILIDRLRLLNLLREDLNVFEGTRPHQEVERILLERDTVV